MSLVNAVHELIEVAAGRKNLSGVAADELHAAIDAEQAPVVVYPDPGPVPTPAENLAGPSTGEPTPGTAQTGWQVQQYG